MIAITSFGTTPDGAEARVFELAEGAARVRVSDFGATVVGVDVPDARGSVSDVALGFADVSGYAGPNGACYGGTIGPVANRTDRAEVPIGGTTYRLAGNDGPDRANNLHSDLDRGLHKRLWSAVADEEKNAVTMTCSLADGELGLPGNRAFTACFELAAGADGSIELTVAYGCESDAPTYVNMTNHSYFNLSGHDSGDVLGTLVSVDADGFLPLRDDCVSAGEVRPVDGTPFDFREPRALGERIDADDEQIRIARGYDHCLCVRGWEGAGSPRHALRAVDPASGRSLDVLVTAPGAHLYTGNWLDDRDAKGGAAYAPRSGFAFEPEFYPDCVHHGDWPQSVCGPGAPYASTIVYRFSVAR